MGDRFQNAVEVPDVLVDPSAPEAGYLRFFGKNKRPTFRNSDGKVFDIGPFLDAFQGATKQTDLRVFTQWQNSTRSGTQDGQVTFYPTTTGDASGTPLFSSVLFAAAMPFAGAVSSNDTHFCGGRSVAADLKSVGFNVTRGSAVVLGGSGLQSGLAATPCCCVIVGVAA